MSRRKRDAILLSINETSPEVETNANLNNQVEMIENESNSKLKSIWKSLSKVK